LEMTADVDGRQPRLIVMPSIKESIEGPIADGNGMVMDVVWAITKIAMGEALWAALNTDALLRMLVVVGTRKVWLVAITDGV